VGQTIIDFLASNRLPGMFPTREIVTAGGLISYGASLSDLFLSDLFARRWIRAQDLARHQSSNAPRWGARQIRACDQFQDCQRTWHGRFWLAPMSSLN